MLGQLVHAIDQALVGQLVQLLAQAPAQCGLELVAFSPELAVVGAGQFQVGGQAGKPL